MTLDRSAPALHLPFLTADIPGIGGVIRQRDSDFFVEELPLYEPTGTGEHLYLFIEKQNLPTMEAVRQIARLFRCRKSNIGYAGLKDRHAVTRQYFSIHLPGRESEDAGFLEQFKAQQSLHLLWAMRHTNKLHRGHLAGNRFVIHIRNVSVTSVLNAKRILDRLLTTGVPNYFGSQRFGYRGDNGQLGKLLILGRWEEFLDQFLGRPAPHESEPTRLGREAYEKRDYRAALEIWPHRLRPHRQVLDALFKGLDPRRAVMSVDPMQLGFLTSALQSQVFNHVLTRRMQMGLLDKLVPGDLAWKHGNRAVFAVDQATADLENSDAGRVRSLQVSPSGPMWGVKMTRASGDVAMWEREALQREGLDEQSLVNSPVPMQGERRPMRAVLTEPDIAAGADEHGPFVRVQFNLPRGSFATVALREIMKSSEAEQAEESISHEA